MARALTVPGVIAGEATSGSIEDRWNDMLGIASVIYNRAQQLGVSMQDVIANTDEFNAYGNALPPGVGQEIVDLAQEAVDYVEQNGPVNNATFYATPAAADNLPGQLSFETETAGHQFFSDPLGRAIRTAVGTIKPNAYAYAANIENAPIPAKNPAAIPTDNPALLAGAPLAGVDPNLAFGVADPVNNLPSPDLATAQSFEKATPSVNPWGGAPLANVAAQGVLAGTNPMEASTSTQNNGVMAGLQSDGYSQMAAAGPFGGDYAAPEDRFGPSPGVMSGIPTQQISQADIDRGLFNATGANEMDPAFTEAMMGPQSAIVPTAVETTSIAPGQATDQVASAFDASRFGPDVASFDPGRFSDVPAASFDQARLGPALVNPATNVASFVDQPADLGSMPDAYAAQRQAPTGLNSAEMQAMQGHVAYAAQKEAAARQAAANGVLSGIPSSMTSNVPAVDTAGVMAAPNFNQAVNPSLPSLASTPVDPNPVQMAEINQAAQIPGVIAAKMAPAAVAAYADEPATPPAVAAIEAQTNVPAQSTASALLSPTSITSMTPSFTPAVSNGLFSQPVDQVNQAGFVNELSPNPQIDLSSQIVPGAQNVQAPSLETVTVADEPAISNEQVDIPGPSTTAAVPDTTPSSVARTTTAKATPTSTNKGVLSGLMSKEALGGGVLAGLVGGPIAAPLGVLAGMAVANNGGLTGLLSSPSFSAPTNQIPGGVNSIAGIYGGAQPVGTYAVANNGATITAQPGGWSTYTNKFGVTEAIGPDGKISSYFGALDRDKDAPTPGGYGASGGYAPA